MGNLNKKFKYLEGKVGSRIGTYPKEQSSKQFQQFPPKFRLNYVTRHPIDTTFVVFLMVLCSTLPPPISPYVHAYASRKQAEQGRIIIVNFSWFFLSPIPPSFRVAHFFVFLFPQFFLRYSLFFFPCACCCSVFLFILYSIFHRLLLYPFSSFLSPFLYIVTWPSF